MVHKKPEAAQFKAAHAIKPDGSLTIESSRHSGDQQQETPDHKSQKVELTSEGISHQKHENKSEYFGENSGCRGKRRIHQKIKGTTRQPS